MKINTWLSIFTAVLTLCLTSVVQGQVIQYGNDWYKNTVDRTFIKLLVAEDGIYRVTAQDLASAGYDLSSVDARFLQLMYRGKEVRMHVSKAPSGQLVYLEFYGKRNDGRIDSVMYRDPITGLHSPRHQPTIHQSIFTDTSAYFLSWSQNTPGLRYFDYAEVGYSLIPEEPHFKYEAMLEFRKEDNTAVYVIAGGGPYDSFHSLNSDFVTGEGLVSRLGFSVGSPAGRTWAIPTPTPANTGSPMIIKSRVFGRSNTAHHLRVLLNGNISKPVVDTSITFSYIYTQTYTREYTANIGNTTDLTFQALQTPTDNNNLCWASITYDRQFDLANGNSVKISDWKKSSDAHMRFVNADGNDSVFVYDLTEGVRNRGVISSPGVAQVIVGFLSTTSERQLFFSTDKGIKKPVIAAPSLNKLHDPAGGAEFVIVSHRKLSAAAEAYRDYRDTCTANPLSVKLVYTDEIYDEYSYGSVTSWGIKRFCKDAIDNWTVKPKFFLLFGKGKTEYRAQEDNLVPTFGYPASDYEFVGHYRQDNSDIKTFASIGRVNVINNDEGFDYLNKVKEYEYQAFQPWMKRGVFLGGGANEGEQRAIANGFDYVMNVFSGAPYGGDTIYFQKTSVAVIDESVDYNKEINEGVSLIHFFGHSSSNLLDIAISEASEYQNNGKYPLMIAMGCFGGDFSGRESFGERWIKEPGKGAIAYLANSSAGYLNPLRDYARIFYDYKFESMLDQPIGDAVATTLAHYADALPGVQYRNHARQMNLQGDPALRLYHAKKPDLAIENSGVFFTPDNFSAKEDSFSINIIAHNYGLVTEQDFAVRILQTLPDRRVYEHPIVSFPMIKYKDTLSLTLFNPIGELMAGKNSFDIFVDALDSIPELRENNNRVSVDLIVPGNIPATLYPVEYAVVGTDRIHLDASTFFMAREAPVRYIYEIDTTYEFNSPAKVVSPIIEGSAIYARWDVPFNLQENTVYYWRVRLVDVQTSIWGVSSFTYIPNKTGWSQGTSAQFEKAEVEQVGIDVLQDEWKFAQFSKNYSIEINQDSSLTQSIFSMAIDNAIETSFGVTLNGVNNSHLFYCIIDKNTLDPTTRRSSPYALMQNIQAPPNNLFVLQNAIQAAEEGDYIFVGSTGNPNVSQWSDNFFEALETFGVSNAIRSASDTKPFLLLGRKGQANGALEVYAPNSGPKYKITSNLYASYESGNVQSTLIGPGKAWDELYWDWRSQDNVVNETAAVDVYGVRYDDSDSLLFENVDPTNVFNLSGIVADDFPFLRLEARLRDSVNRTAPQLDHWRVLYTPVPDGVVDPITAFVFQSDSVQEGEDIYIEMGARNISDYDMDSLLVRFEVLRSNRTRELLGDIRVAPVDAWGRVDFNYTFNTRDKNLSGKLNLLVEINPELEQPEQYTFNNVYQQPFTVGVDKLNPILDVTFDGKRILDGDIISPRPEILIQVNDENPFIAITDSTAFDVYFYEDRPGEGRTPDNQVIVSNSNAKVQWTPATLPENKAQLIFRPGLDEALADGDYILAVQGRDQKGNTSGESFYEISFKVVNEASITHVLNYPNPFSTSTKFVYTFTGEQMPTKFQIHIFTISGKLVKVVDLLEMGDVSVGRNISNYAWDGTDEYGDKLGNGVYLYRVVTEMPGDDLELRTEGTDQYFNNGWGKMYLMR